MLSLNSSSPRCSCFSPSRRAPLGTLLASGSRVLWRWCSPPGAWWSSWPRSPDGHRSMSFTVVAVATTRSPRRSPRGHSVCGWSTSSGGQGPGGCWRQRSSAKRDGLTTPRWGDATTAAALVVSREASPPAAPLTPGGGRGPAGPPRAGQVGSARRQYLMATARQPRNAADIAATLARLQDLADHPGRIERMHGRRELDGLRAIPQDSRRPTEPAGCDRFAADYSSAGADQADNYGSGVL